MKKCPKCESVKISKERWHDAVTDAFSVGGSAANGQTGDLICNDCKYTSSPGSFEDKSEEEKDPE